VIFRVRLGLLLRRNGLFKTRGPGRIVYLAEPTYPSISSNLHPAAFDELMPKTLATATVDRLLHHAHICQTSGESVRLSQALAGQGVSPLA
jgi:IstB-like ATP binding protein.